jgi:pimeloyl-ACP methyl ester carboxylesterase
MTTITPHISRRCRPLQASATVVIVTAAALAASGVDIPAARSAEPANDASYTRSDLMNPTKTRTIRITYRSHTGATRGAIVLVPRWYGPNRHPRIPLLIAPHGRGVSYAVSARRWANLPGIGGFAVVNPAGQGNHVRNYSWGAKGQIDDLARMPEIVASKVPWLRIDRQRIYAFGGSMGGQETLLLAAQHPGLLAGAAAIDSLVDFPRQYRNFPQLRCKAACLRSWNGPIGFGLQRMARTEVGGSPLTAPAAYAARSPLTFASAIAASCVPLQIWWSRTDRIVVDSSKQSGALFHRIRKLNHRAPVTGYTGSWAHTLAFRPGRLLPLALARFGLMPPEFDRKVSGTKVTQAPDNACGR